MAIIYPRQAAASTSTGNGYFNYAVTFFDPNNGPFIVTGSAYTSSFAASAYVLLVNSEVASGSTIDIAVPTASFQVSSGSIGEIVINPAIEFWRLDQNPNVIVRLVTNNPEVGFTKNLFNTSSFYTIPTSSYNSLLSIPAGGNSLFYLMLEKSQLPDSWTIYYKKLIYRSIDREF